MTIRVGRLPTTAENAVDDRVEHAGVGHHAEVEDGEDEHGRHRRRLLDAGDDEAAELGAEAAGQPGDDRHGDERDERRRQPAHDQREQRDDGQEAEQREHEPTALVGLAPRR